jgi:hypothetical protein
MRARLSGISCRLAVLAVVWSLLMPFVMSGHPITETDADCGPVSLGAHATTEFETDLPTDAGEHCAICHRLRAMSGIAPGVSGAFAPALPEVGPGLIHDPRVPGTNHLGLRPTRAPPVGV